jgi:uncharacterized repeat protein (TIGR01451 family)
MIGRKLIISVTTAVLISSSFIIGPLPSVKAGSYDGLDLAYAILANHSTLISSEYLDTDTEGHRQGVALSSLGTMLPTDGSSFTLLSTGIAGIYPATTDGLNPGSERGNWFAGGQYWYPRDSATLTLTLKVPKYMHYIYYDVQFFTTEYPDYVGTQYNDKLTITVESPSQGTSIYVIDVNSGDFVLDSNDVPGTGFDVFASSGDPSYVDWLTTTPNPTGADAGATALVGREHPVFPNETITVTFDIRDAGDNQFDSTAFIDNLRFSGFAQTDIISRKTVQDLNGDPAEPGDVLEYSITISNIGTADQRDNPGNEFIDFIPDNVEYVPGSAEATSGTVAYEAEDNKITWNGAVPAETSVALNFQVTINSSVSNGTVISNQGTVFWDTDEDGRNDATELTDDPAVDDGLDQDGDGDTDDDDPTLITVYSYEPPSIVIEDFSDDAAGGKATESYEGYQWFETSEESGESNFEVASCYHYSTSNSFKTKIRSSSGIRYWNYSLSQLGDIQWWEVWFACGNTSEESDIHLEFKNTDGKNITKIKFEHVDKGSDPLARYVLKLSYLNPSAEWVQLNSAYENGYLFNGWYKLRIERNGDTYINYSLYQAGKGLVDFKTDGIRDSPFSKLACIEWYNSKNPVVCPIFFWDEHKLGLNP